MSFKNSKLLYVLAFPLGAGILSVNQAWASPPKKAAPEQQIRKIVETLLQEKDDKIKQLEARIQQLEKKQQNIEISELAEEKEEQAIEKEVAKLASEKNGQNGGKADSVVAKSKQSKALKAKEERNTIMSKLGDLGEEVAELKASASEKGLEISGFFDINAKTDNSTDQTFSVGSVELDLEYSYNEYFAASSAIVLCGNSAGADYAAPAAITCGGSGPGGLGGGGAGIAVALVDYHLFDNRIPPRGRIFNNQGFHIQAGRFDIPFSTDYQFFANTDRVTITAPITTSRMQFGGYNGDGVRSYGSWGALNYSVFWTDAMYSTDGTSLGGRLGMALGKNNYRSHKNNPDGLEFGLSFLGDLDKNRNLRNSVYGADLSFGYGFLRLQSELMLLQAVDNLVTEEGVDYGKPHELGYHATLLADLDSFIHHPVIAFVRYGRWQPKAQYGYDFDGTLVQIANVSALSAGLNYRFNDYFKLKFEYTDSLGTETQEHYFDRNLGIVQAVVSF